MDWWNDVKELDAWPTDVEIAKMEIDGALFECNFPDGKHPYPVTQILAPREYFRFLRDPLGFVAERLGVDRDQLEGWSKAEGRPLCGAQTKAGTLCSNGIADCSVLPIRDFWQDHRDGYCRIHGS